MFENLTPPNNYTIQCECCQGKFDFVKNLTIAPGRPGPARAAVDDNIIIATYLTIKKGM